MNSENAKRPILAVLLALALGSSVAIAATAPTTPAPSIDIEVWNSATEGWKARLSNEGSQTASWSVDTAGTGAWSWSNLQAGSWFDVNQANGNWGMAQDWIWSGAGFEVDITATGNLDPYISYGMVAKNTSGGLLTFQKVVTAPITPTVTGANRVFASISGGLTDATGNGVTLTAAPNRSQDGNGGNEVQLLLLNSINDFSGAGGYVNAGVDVGDTFSTTGTGTFTYGSYSEGFIDGPVGTWNWMQTRTRFTLTGDNDLAALTGFAEISPIPEPETYAMLLAGIGLLGFMRPRRRA